MPELHEIPLDPVQVKAIKDISMRALTKASDHCDACACRACREAKDCLVTLRLIATIEAAGVKL